MLQSLKFNIFPSLSEYFINVIPKLRGSFRVPDKLKEILHMFKMTRRLHGY